MRMRVEYSFINPRNRMRGADSSLYLCHPLDSIFGNASLLHLTNQLWDDSTREDGLEDRTSCRHLVIACGIDIMDSLVGTVYEVNSERGQESLTTQEGGVSPR